jgi:hypothetical protein
MIQKQMLHLLLEPANTVPSTNSAGVSKDKTTNTAAENASNEKRIGVNVFLLHVVIRLFHQIQ